MVRATPAPNAALREITKWGAPKYVLTRLPLREFSHETQYFGLSDRQIYDQTSAALVLETNLDAREMYINVDAGIVTLNGSVPSAKEKYLAGYIANSIIAVKEVNNRLLISDEGEY